MRSLSTTDNTNAATSDYPYREVRDTEGATDGTKVWVRIFADLLHGIQKLIRYVGLTPNDLPDNESNGYQILDALELLGQSKVFSGTWTDGGSGDVYLLAPDGLPALIVGKMYRFIADKNLLPSDDIYLKVGSVDYSINFQNCDYILSNQVFNVYVSDSSSVILTAVGSLHKYYGKAITKFAGISGSEDIGGVFKYKDRYYLSITSSNNIKIYSNDGDLISTLSTGSLTQPEGITVLDDKIYTTSIIENVGDNPIRVFSLTGSPLFEFGDGVLFDSFVVKSSSETSKIYVVDDTSSSNAFAFNASDGLFSFTVSSTDKIADIAVYGDRLYALIIPTSGESYISTYDANTGALITTALNTFTSANSIEKFYGVTENYFILKSGDDVVLVDRNYNQNATSDPYRDILTTIIYGRDFYAGNVDGNEIYFIDDSGDTNNFTINSFI